MLVDAVCKAFNQSIHRSATGISAPQAAQLDGKAGIIQALFEEGGTLAHLGLGFGIV